MLMHSRFLWNRQVPCSISVCQAGMHSHAYSISMIHFMGTADAQRPCTANAFGAGLGPRDQDAHTKQAAITTLRDSELKKAHPESSLSKVEPHDARYRPSRDGICLRNKFGQASRFQWSEIAAAKTWHAQEPGAVIPTGTCCMQGGKM
eukprot:280112-Pelagomonas_calceolata.AAC.7